MSNKTPQPTDSAAAELLEQKIMKFELNKIITWGRSYDEYVNMFSLNDNQLKLKILSVADGPASFNYKLTSKGGNVTSVDPLYQFTSQQIQTRIAEVYDPVLEETRKNKNKLRDLTNRSDGYESWGF
jgi:hypothetical protein